MSSFTIPKASGDHAQTVASHYNQLEEAGKQQRTFSRIFYLRNFNNWLKSVLINETLQKIREVDRYKKIEVLDLGSGKGGDLLKWKKGKIDYLVCADIAGMSVEQSEVRFRQSYHRDRGFDAEFIVADCTKTRLKTKYKRSSQKFDLVSCQFSFHYCFESYQQAMMMLRNACECLKPGGYFIGTTPNANDIIHRLRKSDSNSFGNEVYSISFDHNERKKFPIFGATYNFHLEGVVDCPEFLVYFPALEKLAAEFGMKLVEKKTFAQYFKENSSKRDYLELLSTMQGLEPYPPSGDRQLVSSVEDDYSLAKEFCSQLRKSHPADGAQQPHHRDSHTSDISIGTLSKAEWEAATIYLVYVFQKVEDITPPMVLTSSETIPQTSLSESSSSS